MTKAAGIARQPSGKHLPIRQLIEQLLPGPDADTDEMLDALADLASVKQQVNWSVRAIVQIAYDEGCTWQEIADALGISQSRAHQLGREPLRGMDR